MNQELITSKALGAEQYQKLLQDLKILIIEQFAEVKKQASNQISLIYWQVGKRISEENIAKNNSYQSSILEDLTKDLEIERSTLSRCVSFFKKYPNSPGSLKWSHYKCLITISDQAARERLEEEIVKENLSAAKLGQRIKNLNETFSPKNTQLKRPTSPSYLYKAKILNVVDGDTLILDIDLGFTNHKKQRIRLSQIDAPEMKTEEGIKSFHFLRDKLVDVDFVVVKTNKVDIFGRYIGDIFYDLTNSLKIDEVFLNGIYLNQEIVSKGFAKLI
jgi:micrococcal nuclease